MSNPKVFEFAKEIGMTPLALMDKIREWQLPVKSHMAEIDPEVMLAIKAKLGESSKPSDGEAKKAAPKKKAAATAKAPAAKAPAKAAKAETSKAAAKPAAAAAATPAAKAGTVVRRKAKTEAEIEAAAEEEARSQAVEAPEVSAAPSAPVAAEPVVEKVIEEKQPVAAATPQAAAVTPSPVAAATPQTASKPPMARKKEVAIGQSGVESSQTSAAPKRNIIGRMDLSRVQSQAPQGQGGYQNRGPRPQGGPGGGSGGPGGAGGGFAGGPRRPSTGNLRAGFVQQAPSVPDFVVGDDSRKREDKKRPRGGAPNAEAGPAAPVEGEQPKHFDAAEFRKREMVFQPKKKKGMLSRPALQTQITKPDASKRIVEFHGKMRVSDFANSMKIKAPELVKALMKNGVTAAMNTDLDFDTAALIAPEFGYEVINVVRSVDEVLKGAAFGDMDAAVIHRPPVVTIMGHVDHGKTSLLDAIRNANVASGEAGGITQHIGAYQVKLESGQLVTFLDTPGHEAFTAMRARGANVTDIAVIVVAADDGVMPQTAEAISHAKAAGVPMIVAMNKMDKPGANPDKLKQQLTEFEVVSEEWGGDTIFAPVSALKKTGIKELLEQILLVAEVEDLKANPKRSGTGAVIESRLEKGRGNVATILVQDGTVKVGQHVVAGTIIGRVRSMMNDRGERVQEAGPGMPIEVLGLDGTPSAGDQFDVVTDEKAAQEAAQIRRNQVELEKNPSSKMSLEELFSKVSKGDVKDLNIVLKADVAGSMEAIIGMFSKLVTPEVKVKVIHSAVGGITENDILLASTAKGIVVGFNVRPDGNASSAAKRMGVEIRTYGIVYELMDDMKKAMAGMLQPDIVEKVMGRAEVRNTFSVPKIGTIAGCSVLDGKIQRSNLARLVRDGKVIYEGKISSLKRFKDDAREVASGFECGIGIENFNDVKVGDVIEAFIKEEVVKELTIPAQP